MNSSGNESMFLNKYARSIRSKGFLGASLYGKAVGINNCSGVGDCLLLDVTKSFFAVADASDRNTTASRDFMKMFSKMLSKINIPSTDYVHEEDVNNLKEQINKETESLLHSLPFRDGCTFTGILILKTRKGPCAIIIHTGDSFLIACDIRSGNTSQLTKNNFWMVGRTQHFFQIEELYINNDTKLLLATDGFDSIFVPQGMSREEYVLKLFRSLNVDEIPDSIFDQIDNHHAIRDDIAIIAVDPMVMIRLPCRFIFGGTSQAEENDFNERKMRGIYKDQYLPCSMLVDDPVNNVLLL